MLDLATLRRVPRSIRNRPGSREIDWSTCPPRHRQKVSAVVRNHGEAERLVAFFGHGEWIPNMPVLLMMPGEATLIGIDQKNHPMTARMLQDQAEGLYAQETAAMRADTRGLVLRERGGPLEPVDVLRQVPNALRRQRDAEGDL